MDDNTIFSEINKKRWDKLADKHFHTDYYGFNAFRKGKSSLQTIEAQEIPNVAGKKVLHLQCHFGMDSLSLARMGAHVTGVDYSSKAIELANQLKDQMGIDTTFFCSDIYALSELIPEEEGSFDFVFTSHGVLCWLSDLPAWGNLIAFFLKPSGRFYVIDDHPTTGIFDNEVDRFEVIIPYFTGGEVYKFEAQGSYIDRVSEIPIKDLETTDSYEWLHSLSDIVMALINAGLEIELLNEHPYSSWRRFPFLVKADNEMWTFKKGSTNIPLLFSILARKK